MHDTWIDEHTGDELTARPAFEADDFGEAFTPELREQEDRLRAEVEAWRKQSRDGGHVTCPDVVKSKGAQTCTSMANKEAFRRHASEAAAVFKEFGALSVVECWGDDVPEGTINSMHTAVLRKDDETVVFSWITWPDKATRNAGMAAMMDDPRMSPERNPMPFDGKRMIFGGFEAIVSA